MIWTLLSFVCVYTPGLFTAVGGTGGDISREPVTLGATSSVGCVKRIPNCGYVFVMKWQDADAKLK